MSRIKIAFITLSIIYIIHKSDGTFWKDYIEPTSAVLSIDTNFQESCAQRQAPGFVCMNCRILARCVFRGNMWDTIALEACDEAQGFYCHASEGRCSQNPGPCHPGAGAGDTLFACTSSGIFPDPWNCQQYHMCFPSGLQIVSVNVRCGGNTAFNPVTSDCSLSTTNNICQGQQFTCNEVGQMGAWPMNANIYYICMARTNANIRMLYPELYRCPVGLVFHNEDCVPPNGGGGGGNDFRCIRSGLFPDPANCRAYFFCDGNLRSQHITCPTGTYFNQIVNGCVRGTCPTNRIY